jgi:predicted Zn-dependent protease
VNTKKQHFKWVVVLLSFLLIIFPIHSENLKINKEDFLLGLYLSAQIEKRNKVIKDHKDWPRVVEIASRIMANTRGSIYSFQIIEAPVANAFALPGGFIFITDKLLDLELEDAELAFLIGHEIAHVSQKHFSKIMQGQSKVSIANTIAMIGTVLLSQLGKNDQRRMINQGAYHKHGAPKIKDNVRSNVPAHLIPILAGNIFGTLYLMESRREFEYEADLVGAKLAMLAGYDFNAGLGMLKKLFYANYRDLRYEKWTTHPLTVKRTQALKSKLSSTTKANKKSVGWVREYQLKYCEQLMKAYDQCVLWKKPSMLKGDIKYDHVRSILLNRIQHFNENEVMARTVLRKEIVNHLNPNIKKQSFLRANYGQLYEKMLQLKKMSGVIDQKLYDNLKVKRDENLSFHLKSMREKSPSKKQFQYMIHNFPNHVNLNEWKFGKWKKESNISLKINEAESIKELNYDSKAFIEELHKIEKGIEKNPLSYTRIKALQNEGFDKEHFKKQVESCDSLKTLTEFQHEYPDHENIDLILEKKNELVKTKFQTGKLAVFSHQHYDAVKSYHDILLYGRGSDYEEEAKRQIFKLNTLNKNRLKE